VSYLYVGVGGSGAKLMHALVHLTAAGMLSRSGRELMGLLGDSDQANGNVAACIQAAAAYKRCRQLSLGSTAPLFRNPLEVQGPWSPVEDPDSASLSTIFDHALMRRSDADAADLMELLFSTEERDLTIFEGFRGRPAIGSAISGKTVSLEADAWKDLHSRAMNARNQEDVSLLLAGSVFGGSGAAGVPTICRLLQQSLDKKINNLRLGLMLFLYVSCEVGIWNWLVQHLMAQGIPEARALNVLSLGFALGLLVGRVAVSPVLITVPPEVVTLHLTGTAGA